MLALARSSEAEDELLLEDGDDEEPPDIATSAGAAFGFALVLPACMRLAFGSGAGSAACVPDKPGLLGAWAASRSKTLRAMWFLHVGSYSGSCAGPGQ